MNLKLIRLRARTMQVQQPGLAILFALPVLLTILANFLVKWARSGRSTTGYDLAASKYLHDPATTLSFCRLLCHLHFSGWCDF